MTKPISWSFFISGRGSNLMALLDEVGWQNARLVVSSRRAADGVKKARRRGVPTLCLPQKVDWSFLSSELRRRGVQGIFLVGFMKILPAEFIREWRGCLLNVHPSLLPAYPGLRSMERSYKDNQPMGVTVHEVNEEVDGGRILLQKKLVDEPQQSGLSLNELEFRIHLIEHELVREAVRKWTPRPM